MSKRFQFVQKFEEYIDYDTDLVGLDEIEIQTEGLTEEVRRLTLVEPRCADPMLNRPTERHAYLTMRDYTEKVITWEEAQQLLV